MHQYVYYPLNSPEMTQHRIDVKVLLVSFNSWNQSKTHWQALPWNNLNRQRWNFILSSWKPASAYLDGTSLLLVMPQISFIFCILPPNLRTSECKNSFAFMFHILELFLIWKLQYIFSKYYSHIFLLCFSIKTCIWICGWNSVGNFPKLKLSL